MKPNLPPHFKCIACTKVYRWRAEMAGRKVLCSCGLIMRAPKTPDIKPTAIGHRAPVVKPSEARVHARVGENAVVDMTLPEWAEESCTVSLGSSDVLVDDPKQLDLNLDLDLKVEANSLVDSYTGLPLNLDRPEAPAPRQNKPGSSASIKAEQPPTTKLVHDQDACPNCKSKVRVGAVICVQCGTNLQTGEAVSKTLPPEPANTTGSGLLSRVLQAVVGNKQPEPDK